MITSTARASVKSRLDISASDTTFDSQIDEFVLSGVSRLYPIAQKELAVQTKVVTVDGFGEASFDLATLTTPAIAARKVDYSTGGAYSPAPETYHNGTNLIVRDLPSFSTATLKVYGLAAFVLADVPTYLEQAVIWYAMSEFYDFLAGNKRKYNLYTQSGARSVDNMKDESEYYEQKANVYLNDRAQLYGVA